MKKLRIGLIGCGAIGGHLAKRIEGDDSLELAGIFDADETRGTVGSVGELLAKEPDLVVEAAGAEAVKQYAEAVLEKTDFLIMSSSALAEKEFEKLVRAKCAEKGTKLFIPSGAIVGVDGVNAVREELESAEIETRKNPKGFGREDTEETVLFDGSAREACKKFPKNVNVSATLSLNGIGFDKTRARIISDPKVQANTHTITCSGGFGKFTIKVEGVPSKNPKTSSLAGTTAFAEIKRIQEGNSVIP